MLDAQRAGRGHATATYPRSHLRGRQHTERGPLASGGTVPDLIRRRPHGPLMRPLFTPTAEDELLVLDWTVVQEMDALVRLIDAVPISAASSACPLIDVRSRRRRPRRDGTAGLWQARSAISSASSPPTAACAPCATSSPPSPAWWPKSAASSPPMSRRPIRSTTCSVQQLRARLIEAGYGNVNIAKGATRPARRPVVRIGARLYDTSLKSRLQRLQYAMKGAA